MAYIIILKVRKFHQPTANRFSTARKKPVVPRPSLNLLKASGSFPKYAAILEAGLGYLVSLSFSKYNTFKVNKQNELTE